MVPLPTNVPTCGAVASFFTWGLFRAFTSILSALNLLLFIASPKFIVAVDASSASKISRPPPIPSTMTFMPLLSILVLLIALIRKGAKASSLVACLASSSLPLTVTVLLPLCLIKLVVSMYPVKATGTVQIEAFKVLLLSESTLLVLELILMVLPTKLALSTSRLWCSTTLTRFVATAITPREAWA